MRGQESRGFLVWQKRLVWLYGSAPVSLAAVLPTNIRFQQED